MGIASRAWEIRLERDEGFKEEDARRRGSPPAEPTPIPGGWTNTVHLRRVESSRGGYARNQEKMFRASKDVVRFERLTL